MFFSVFFKLSVSSLTLKEGVSQRAFKTTFCVSFVTRDISCVTREPPYESFTVSSVADKERLFKSSEADSKFNSSSFGRTCSAVVFSCVSCS